MSERIAVKNWKRIDSKKKQTRRQKGLYRFETGRRIKSTTNQQPINNQSTRCKMNLKDINAIIRANANVKQQRQRRKKGLELLGIAIESGDQELISGIPALLAKKDATLSAEFAAVINFLNAQNAQNAEKGGNAND